MFVFAMDKKNGIVDVEDLEGTSNIPFFSLDFDEGGLKKNLVVKKIFPELAVALLAISGKPVLNIRIGAKEYKIEAGERYRGNWENEMDEAIKSKIGEGELCEEFFCDVKNFLLEPFQLNDKYGKEIMRYYVGNILECIKEKDIVSQYILYKLRVYEKEEMKEKNLGFVWNDTDKLKLLSFINYLEKNSRDVLGENYGRIIDIYKERLVTESKGNFDKWIKVESTSIITKEFKTKEQFVGICGNISQFLGKGWDGNKENILKKLFDDLNNGVIIRKEITHYKGKELVAFIQKKTNYKFNLNGNELKLYLDGEVIVIHNIWCPDYNKLKCLERYITDDRVSSIKETIRDVFGINLVLSDNEYRQCGKKTGCDLLVFMLNILISKINADKKSEVEALNEKIKAVEGKRLKVICPDASISEQYDGILRKIIDSGLLYCFEAIELSNIEIKQLQEKVFSFEQGMNVDKIDVSGDVNVIKGKIREKKEDLDRLYELFNWCMKCKKGEYDVDALETLNISIGKRLNVSMEKNISVEKQIGRTIQLRKIIFLKKLFESDKLNLDDKFYYSKIILSIKKLGDKIKSRDWEHDEVLKDLFGENQVDVNFELVKVKDVLGEIDTRFGVTENIDKKYIDDWLENQEEKSMYRVNEVIGLAILKAILVGRYLELKGLDEYLEIFSEEDVRKEKSQIERASETRFIGKLKDFLEILGVNDDIKIVEIEELDKLFPGALESYLKECLSMGALKFGNLSAIDYKGGKLDFSIIQAGILEKAVECGRGPEVLEYLGFFFDDGVMDDIVEERMNVAFMNQVKQFIKFLHSGKQGCFNDTYPGFQKAFTDNGWRKLDFGKENDLLRKKTKKNKFGIGKSGQLFRLAGIQNNGFYIIMRFFKHAHSTHDYDEYVSKDVKDLDKTAFKKITKTLW